jgi:hypothetical protein
LQPGQTLYYELKFGVQASGSFRYNATIELLLSGGALSDFSQDNFSGARLDPANRTGSSGEDLASRNLNWSLPLVSLPGRAGLDLGLSLAYNSLVWTRSGRQSGLTQTTDSPAGRLQICSDYPLQ